MSASSAAPNIDSSSPQQAAETEGESNNSQASEPADDKILPTQRNPNGSEDSMNNGHVDPSIDESILNSEIYQIYCRAEGPYEAAQKISQHNKCVLFEQARNGITEEEFKRVSRRTLSKLWQEKALVKESKFDRLKNFIDGTIKDEVLGRSFDATSMRGVFQYGMTKIQVVNPNGYEYFYVENFKMGHHNRRYKMQNRNDDVEMVDVEVVTSKWYRAVSSESGKAQRLAQLNVLGITNSIMDQIQFNHYLTQNSSKTQLLDFAQRFFNGDCLMNQDCRYNPRTGFDRKGTFYLIANEP